MTILITADLHLDLWARAGRDPFAGILPVLRDLDALIIAGDLANDPQRNWPWALARLGRLVAPARIWVIPGNHDYYGATLDDDILARIATEAGVGLVQKQVLTFGTCPCCAARFGPTSPCWAIHKRRWTARRWSCRITPGFVEAMVNSSAPRIPSRFPTRR